MATHEMFMFVNAGSGGKTGQQILDTVKQPLYIVANDGSTVNLRIFKLTPDGNPYPAGSKPGFQALRQSAAGRQIRVVVAGGDGTVKWVLSEMAAHSISEAGVILGILPLGTGNDFAQAMGWGATVPDSVKKIGWEGTLLEMGKQWWAASQRMLDVWTVRIDVDRENGDVVHVDSKSRVGEETGKVFMSEVMINYFSMGLDAQTGYGMDKKRTSSRAGNFCVYIWEGLKKTLPCRTINRISDFIDSVYEGTSNQGRLIFDSLGLDPERPTLVTDKPRLLAVCNISSYAGGTAHFWKNAHRLGVTRPLDPDLLMREADPGDGKLELVTVRNVLSLAGDKVAGTLPFPIFGAKRIFQGAPLFVEFAEDEFSNEKISFIQIDGEFWKLVNPISASVSLKQRVAVLYNDDFEEFESSEEDDSDEDGGCCSCCPPRNDDARTYTEVA